MIPATGKRGRPKSAAKKKATTFSLPPDVYRYLREQGRAAFNDGVRKALDAAIDRCNLINEIPGKLDKKSAGLCNCSVALKPEQVDWLDRNICKSYRAAFIREAVVTFLKKEIEQ